MCSTFRSSAIVMLCLVLTGCPQNPATMTQNQIEAMLKENLTLKEVAISPNPAGDGYSGSGVATDGTKFKVSVQQNAAERKLTYSAANESDPDETRTGSLQLK